MSYIFRSITSSITRLLSVKSDPRPTNSNWTFWLKIVLRTRKCPLSFVKTPCTQHSNIHYSSQFKAIHQNDSKYYLKCTLSGSRLKNSKISETVNTILEIPKIVLGRHFGSVYVVKIQLFGSFLVPCHFILQIICTSHFLDK